MADYSLTSANVLASGTAVKTTGVAGETIVAGNFVTQDPTAGNKWIILDGQGGMDAPTNPLGVALNSASDGQPLSVAASDEDFAHGLTGVAAGHVIVASPNNPGALAPVSEIIGIAEIYPIVVMIATSATKAKLAPFAGLARIP